MVISEIRTRKAGIEGRRIRLAASILAFVATVLLVVAIEAWTRAPVVGPPVPIGPTVCLFEGSPAPCS